MGRSIGRIAGIVIFSLAGGAMPFTLAGQVKQPPPDPAAVSSRPSTAPATGTIGAEQAASAARAWLDALKRRDMEALAERTRFPFTYRSTNRRKLCEATSADARQLTAVVDCLARRDKLLLEELARAAKVEVKVLEPARAPAWLAKLIGKPAGGDWLVGGFLNGDGITFEFVLVVLAGGSGPGVVKAFLVNADVESG